jgi:hypothetical protein
MKYHVFFTREDGLPSPHGPSPVYAGGIVEAQRLAQLTLEDLQDSGIMDGWSIYTVVEAAHGF